MGTGGEIATAIAALVTALFAALIAFGQALQQYASSGQLIRLCDAIVYGGDGGLPGQGRRYWSWTQFRFRVIYEVPRLSIPLLSEPLDHIDDDEKVLSFHLSPLHVRPSMHDPTSEGFMFAKLHVVTGEAAWMTFCRFLQYKQIMNIDLDFIPGDADRCPPDLPTIPSPISMRSVALMALMAGMECIDASFQARSISFQSRDGSITTSQHPVLGPLLHFTTSHRLLACPAQLFRVHRQWVERAHGYIPFRFHTVRDTAWLTQEESNDAELQTWLRRTPISRSNKSRLLLRRSSNEPEIPSEHFQQVRRYTSRRELANQSNEHLHKMLWYWLSQMNVILGPWATSLKGLVDGPFLEDCQSLLLENFRHIPPEYGIDLAAATQRVELLLLTDNVLYCTFPPYARDRPPALRSGEDTQPLPLKDYIDSCVLECRVPAIQLFGDYSQSADFKLFDAPNQELMCIDAWLDAAALSPHILRGRSRLLQRTPYLVQRWLQGLYQRFQNNQPIWPDRFGIARLNADLLEDSIELEQAELIFLLMALVRTVKIGLCIATGFDTTKLIDILDNDVQAHMV